MIIIFIFFLLVISVFSNAQLFECVQLHEPSIQKVFMTRKSHITLLCDRKGVQYLVKQNKQIREGVLTAQGQFYTVRELYGSYVAQYLGLRSQYVYLIPQGKNFLGKQFPEGLATLHRAVPGISIKKTPKYKLVFVKQWAPGRKIYSKDLGLNACVIKSMTMHQELPDIVAFDTYIGNNDRSRNNIFYEHITNHFYIIDMDCSLSFNMAGVACDQLMELSKTYYFSSKELRALKVYCDALERYVRLCPLSTLHEIFDEICISCGFSPGGFFEDYNNLVQKHRAIIKENYEDSIRLIDIIKYVMKKYTEKLYKLVN